jgi:tetratricopeptide (TPR) repeat protein
VFVDVTSRTIVVPTTDGALHVLRAGAGLDVLFPPLRLTGQITAAGISHDGRWLAAASSARRAQVWSLETGDAVSPQRSVGALPLTASFSGSRFQVSGLDASVRNLRPIGGSNETLTKLARFLSGYELTGSHLVPIPVARLIALARDPELAVVIARSDDARWQWLAATTHLSGGAWAAAEAVTGAMVRDSGARWEVWAARGAALAELGRWKEAEQAYGHALARRPDWTELHYYRALARAAQGDGGAIQTDCAAVLESLGATRNPDRAHWLARLCGLAATRDPSAAARLVELARLASEVEPDIEAFTFVHAGASFRAGDYAGASALLTRQLTPAPIMGARPEMSLLLSLAERARGDKRASAHALARFENEMSGARLPWSRRLEIDIWLRELRR